MTRAGDGDTTSQRIIKVKRSMKKCEACRTRKIACNPRDREWSENVKERCNNCDNLDLPCGPSVRMNAKFESGPRKLASKNASEAAGASAGPDAASGKGRPEFNVYSNDGNGLQQTGPSEPQVQALPQAKTRGRAAIDQATIFENQNSDVEMALDSNSPRNFRIFGAAGTSQTTYDSMAVPRIGFGGAAAMRYRPSTASNPTQYPASVRSKDTRLDDFASLPEGPVPIELRSHNDFESLGNAHFPVETVDTLRQPKILNLNPRLTDLEYASQPDLQITENDPSFACGLVPLQSDRNFRLLELLPGHGSAPLVARLTEASVESTYEALSYVWDEMSSNFFIIHVYTGNTVTAAAIAPNLANALKTLRYPENPRTIWIDALCINQKDATEKSAQTMRMGDIFRHAKNLCIWLGPASSNSHLAFELITRCTDLERFEELNQNPGLVLYWDAFTDLMKRPWFRRRWAILEICFARDASVHCGSLRVGWKEFKQTVLLVITKYHGLRHHIRSANERLLDSLHDVSLLDAGRLIRLADKTVRKSAGGDVLQYLQTLDLLMFNCAWTECRDPRDMMYALFGLSRRTGSGARRGRSFLPVAAGASSMISFDEEVHTSESARDSNARSERHEVGEPTRFPILNGIKIDYAKSVFEVCRDFSLYTVNHSRSLDFICRPWAPQGQDLPSWMPTLSSNSYVVGKDGFYRRAAADPLVGNSNLGGLTAYNAALETEPFYRYDAIATPRELSLFGFVCGEVKAKKPPATAGIVPSSWLDDKEFLNRTRNSKESLCRTIVADRGPESPYPPPSYYALVWDCISEQRATGSNLDTAEFRAVEEQDSILDEFLARVQSTVWGRRLLLAAVGDVQLLALGPEHAKKRDLICILHGCTVPVLLRKVNERGNGSNGVQYRLIGVCYVDGIMNGEAFDMQDRKMEHFTLV